MPREGEREESRAGLFGRTRYLDHPKWLQTTYGCEVVTFTADLGQGEELEPARAKAMMLGIKPEKSSSRTCAKSSCATTCSRCSAPMRSRGQYLLGTSIARPLIAKKQIEIAEKVGADAVAHGATGKGNDQVRFELGYYALKPDVKVIAPWREWDFRSRDDCSPMPRSTRSRSPRTSAARRRSRPTPTSAHLVRGQSAGKPGAEVPEYVYSRTVDPENAPDGRHSRIDFGPRRSGRHRRPDALAGGAADAAQRRSAARTASAGSIWWRTASSA